MSLVGAHAERAAEARVAATATPLAGLAAPAILGLVALLAGLVAAFAVDFPHNEGSAYYVAVAGNLAAGRGLVIDALWSYATLPLELPRPAFELWQPLASLIAALPMFLIGGSFAAAQLGGVVAGAALAPLAWVVTREAGALMHVTPGRLRILAVGSGLLAAVGAPLLIARAVPDSTLAFAVFGTLACWLVPRALSGGHAVGLALGGALGLAYLARHEAIWIGLVVLLLAAAAGRAGLRRLAPVVVGGALTVGPWLARNLAVFGTPLPGQALDNALLTGNEQIFAYAERPTLDAFLAQGPGPLIANIVGAAAHNLVEVLLLPALPVGALGLVGTAWLLRRPSLRSSALGVLLLAGLLIFGASSVIFPIATLWGTFAHAAGPLIVGLTVAAVLLTDRVVEFAGRTRGWQRANTWFGPLALLAVAGAMSALQLTVVATQAQHTRAHTAELAAVVAAQPEVGAGARPLLVSDRPIWLAAATGLPALVLPRQGAEVVLRLVDDLGHGATLIVLTDGRLDPRQGASERAAACFAERDAPGAPPRALILVVAAGCTR